MALGSLQKRKFIRWFYLLDANKSGAITEEDSVIVINNQAKLRGWDEEKKAFWVANTHKVWLEIAALCDTNSDGEITLDEWLSSMEQLTAEGVDKAKGVNSIFQNIAGLMCMSHGGVAKPGDYVNFLKAYEALEGVDAKFVFSKLDLDGSGEITKDEIRSLAADFLFSNDPEAPGNWFFGPY